MSSYSPSINTADLDPSWSTILLSLRDLRRNVPINFNFYPGVALTSACFADNVYTAEKITCFSNLIEMGYRKFVIDLWLNTADGTWGVCPVPMPTTAKTLKGRGIDAERLSESAIKFESSHHHGRRESSNATLKATTSAVVIGNYTCSPNFNATNLFDVFSSWVSSTDTDLFARISLFVLNLHELPSTNTSSDSPTPQSLSSLIKDSFTNIYTPVTLARDRLNLNSSWWSSGPIPESIYYHIDQHLDNDGDDGIWTSDDGWPTEEWLEFDVQERVLFSYGTVNESMGYDAASLGDTSMIFPAGFMGTPLQTSAGTPNCYYNSTNNTDLNVYTTVDQANSSWAQIADSNSVPFQEDYVATVIRCGYSITVDSIQQTDNSTDGVRYFDILKISNLWSWDTDEPANTTTEVDTFRCASIGTSDGQWRVRNCGETKKVACRVMKRPYHWRLGSEGTYYVAEDLCGDDAVFDVPRNALENQYLWEVMRNAGLAQEDRVWVDFNSLAVNGCWTSGGANATCPYTDTNYGKREVIVPTVAAVIVLIIFALMMFAKIGSGRMEQSRKKRRRMLKRRVKEGVEYEGVPS